jgi:ATP-binding cassette subfamily B protein/subfamily B ATP-binding cassette protein MsbA
MAFRPLSSRRRYKTYLSDLKNRRAAGEFKNPLPAHSSHSQPQKPRHRGFLELLACFWGMLTGHKPAIVFALATLTLSTLLQLIPPAATKFTIDYVLGSRPLPSSLASALGPWAGKDRLLWLLGAAVVAVSATGTVLHLAGRWTATRATRRVAAAMRHRVFSHAVRLPLQRVYQLKSGGVASILREDAGGVSELIFSMLYNPWRAVIQLLGSVAVLAWVDWRLLIGALVVFPLVYFTHRTWIRRIRPLHRDIRLVRQDIDGHATEAFGGMRVVRAFGRERSEAARFTFGNHFMTRQELTAWWWARGIEVLWEILIPFASALLLLYGGTQVLSGRLSLGDLMMFLVYVAMLLGPIAVLANSATQLQSNLAGLDRVLDLLAEPKEMPTEGGHVSVKPRFVDGGISLRGVSFTYPGAAGPAIRDFSLEVEPGQMIALVGPSGAGKTTLCNLIARFYDPTEGQILLDGRDLRHIDVQSYRQLLGIVEQEVFLFDGTVAENIGYARRHAAVHQIQEAARAANSHDFIMALEQGYQTVIGERGVRLSGGQRQRIAIARALLADPRLLILDEATSNLDTESERLIQDSLQVLMKGRTSFVIAHRLSTITHADRIVVIEEGRLIESGTHHELMRESGRYRQMVQVQLGRALEPEENPVSQRA